MARETLEGIRPGLEGSSNSSVRLKGPFSSPHPAQKLLKASMDRPPWLAADPSGMASTANAVKQATSQGNAALQH